MINFDNFKKYQESFGYMTQQLCFPEKLTFHSKIFEEMISKDHPTCEDLVALRNVMMIFSLSEVKAIYADTFDFTKKALLYMTYNKFDTQRGRGQMLAKLRVLYEMFGLEMVDNGLSDHLPSMLQFLQVAEWRNDPRAEGNIQLITMIIGDRTYVMANAPGEGNNPCAYMVQIPRRTLRLCLTSPKGVKHHV